MDETIVIGISLSASGQATVESAVGKVLFDYALALEDALDLPVDVQHVLAAIVLAARAGELDANTRLRADDNKMLDKLTPHVRAVFDQFGGKVGEDD